MKKHILIVSILLVGLSIQAQTGGSPVFKSMLVTTNKLYALDINGLLTVWDLGNLDKVYKSTDTTVHFTSIAQDKHRQIFIGTQKGKILKLDTFDFTTEVFIKLKKNVPISEILFNSKNEIFLIVPYAVYDPVNDQYWNKFKHQPNGLVIQKRRFLFFFRKRNDTFFNMPQYTFIDSEDRIWMTRSFGEFGGWLQIFDTKNRKELNADFDNLNFGLLFPKSVFEDDNHNIYITSGLQHFGNSGRIIKIDEKTVSVIYTSEDFRDTTDTNSPDAGIFVGPGLYNHMEQKVYFATTSGFYKADIPTEGRIKNPEFIFKPELDWEREPLAIGVGMTIKKLELTEDNRLVFLTPNNGIGIYDGVKLIMLK